MDVRLPNWFDSSMTELRSSNPEKLMVMGACSDGQFGVTKKENGCDKPMPFYFQPPSNGKSKTTFYFQTPDGQPDPLVQFCCGERHSMALTESGKVYSCGANDQGQLGRTTSEIINLVEFRPGVSIVQVAAGQIHNLAVADDGRLFAWGSNDNLQCGSPVNVEVIWKPTRVSEMSQVCQVACGSLSSAVLLECNEIPKYCILGNRVFVFGWYLGERVKPFEVISLRSVPIAQITAGGDHFAILSSGGSVMCWGLNDYGQSSIVGVKEVREPVRVVGLQDVIQVECGAAHTAVLTQGGRIYCFGANNFGQLGSGQRSDPKPSPLPVVSLMGTDVQAIACGRSHTLALSAEKLYSFGLNNNGQLGVGDFNDVFVPLGTTVNNAKALFAGWDQSVILCCSRALQNYRKIPRILTSETLQQLMDAHDEIGVIEYLGYVFTNLGCLNGSFPHQTIRCTDVDHGIDMDDVMKTFNIIEESSRASRYFEEIWSSLLQQDIVQKNSILREKATKGDYFHFVYDEFKFVLMLVWFPPLMSTTKTNDVMQKLGESLLSHIQLAARVHNNLITKWIRTLPTRHFNRVVQFLLRYVEFCMNRGDETNRFVPALEILKEMCSMNSVMNKIPYSGFYLNILGSKVPVDLDYIRYFADKHPQLGLLVPQIRNHASDFYWSNYPFVMNAEVKSKILEADSALHMKLTMMRMGIIGQVFPEANFLTYQVRRSNLVEDTYTCVMQTPLSEMTKPLRVVFDGEEGEDHGGIRKEFFMLLFQDILQPTYGMFAEDSDSHMIWFSGMETDKIGYEVVGCLCGLALFNGTIVNLPFPLALYKLLLNQPLSLEDFSELHPTEGHSLEKILEYDGDDFEELFDLQFTVNISVLEHNETIELCRNGATKNVTQENKHDFVNRYIKRKLELGKDDVIKGQFESFNRGFRRVLNEDVLRMFQPRELMEMVIGNEDYDWDVFKKNTIYKGEYHAKHPSIIAFWEAFGELTTEQRRKFLLFLMGTDRIPIRGMKEVVMAIQPEPEELIPVAHTCFNLLDLPKVKDKEEMKRKLLVCLEHTHGFSLA